MNENVNMMEDLMDPSRFDALTRRLPSRLRLYLLGAGLLPLGIIAMTTDDAQARKCKEPCPLCQFCKKGKKRKKGKCLPVPDGTLCTFGACFDGICLT